METLMTTRKLTLDLIGPNPPRGRTTLRYTLPAAGRVILELYDVSGERLRSLVRGAEEAGEHAVSFDLETDEGRAIPPGRYLVLLAVNGRHRVLGFEVAG